MAPSGVNDTIRAVMGGAKRWYNQINGTLTTSGTNTILAGYGVAQAAYVTGQRFLLKAGGTNTGATTLNVNSLGAKTVKTIWGSALTGGEIVSGKYFEVLYDGTDMLLLPHLTKGEMLLATTSVAAAATQDYEATAWFDGTFASLRFEIDDFQMGTDNTNLYMALKSGGTYQTDAGEYRLDNLIGDDSAGTAAYADASNTTMLIAQNVDSSTSAHNWAEVRLLNTPSASQRHRFRSEAIFLHNDTGVDLYIAHHRWETAGVMTGLRFGASSGNFTATIRVYGTIA